MKLLAVTILIAAVTIAQAVGVVELKVSRWRLGQRDWRIRLQVEHDIFSVPSSWDWRTKGVVPPVRNQGQLGSSVAFGATAAVESLHAIKTGHLLSASVQEMGECCTPPMEPVPRDIFGCVHRIGGLCSADSYPVHHPGKCGNNSCKAEVQVTGGKFVPEGNETALQTALLESGPVLVLVDASRPSFQEYRAGVYQDPACSRRAVDHALLVVGYGVKGSTRYWICQNSWSSNWGQHGYVWIEMGKNMCGIANYASYPY